jgi:hypothetical protein
MGYSTIETILRRRRALRIILFVIILATFPFYCAGFLLWGTAPRNTGETSIASNTPISNEGLPTVSPLPSLTPLPLTATLLSPLQPTPLQFVPPGRPPGQPTAPFIPPTVFIPTSTLAPTLTFPPTVAPPPTSAPLPTDPPPTETPLPTDPPPPTATPTETPTLTETPTTEGTVEVLPGP